MNELATRQNQTVATIDNARQFLLSPEVQKSLKDGMQKHMTPDRMCRLVLTAVQKSPKLVECFATPQGKRSIGLSMLTAAQIGLEIDGRNAHLVPYKNKGGYMEAVLIPDYKGLVNLAYNHPRVKDINVEVVYTNDVFTYRKGLNPVIEHIPTIDGEPGELRAVYAIATIDGSGKTFVVLPAREVDQVRKSSRGADQPDSPWNKWEAAMWQKTACKRLCKIIPQSPELQRALAVEDEFEDTGKISSSVTIDVRGEPALQFNKPSELPPEQALQTDSPTPEPVVEIPPAETSQTAEANHPTQTAREMTQAEKLEAYYREKCNADFGKVIETAAKLMPKQWSDVTAKAYGELTDQQQKALWASRPTVASMIKSEANKGAK